MRGCSFRDADGVTLTEVLIVVVVIGVLAAIGVPLFLSQTDTAERVSLELDLSNAMSMLATSENLGYSSLPSSFPNDASTFVPGVGPLIPSYSLLRVGSGWELCVEGTTPTGLTMSFSQAAGLREQSCPDAPSLIVQYSDTTFTTGSSAEVLSPTVTGAAGSLTYSVSGSLPAGVSFSTADGTFTGPADSSWNFQAVQVSAGGSHACAVTTQGDAKCWGRNDYGQLGDGTTTDSSTPVTVSGLSNVEEIAAGGSNTCAVLTGGTAKCWGRNNYGQLGDGTTTDRYTPVTVVGLTGATQITVGDAAHSCAVLTGGTTKCWGRNGSGRLGDGTTTDRYTPVTVVGLTGATQIDAGIGFTCAVLTGGTAKCWGRNANGQLGDGLTTDSYTPVTVNLPNVAQITTGNYHTCAVTNVGGAKCWGRNNLGQLGNGTTTEHSVANPVPADVVGLTSGVESVSADSAYSCAVLLDGSAKCWGKNTAGQLGDGTTTDSSIPVTVFGLSGVASVSPAVSHACARLAGGAAVCWGNNFRGQLGNGTTANSFTPVSVTDSGPTPGFPASVTVTVTDSLGATGVTSFNLTQS